MQSSTKNWASVGCEIRGEALENLDLLFDSQLFDHIQITLPSLTDLSKAFALVGRVPLIVHSNLLNTFGSNAWDTLQTPGRKIRSLRPAHVVEHLTLFRDQENKKHG